MDLVFCPDLSSQMKTNESEKILFNPPAVIHLFQITFVSAPLHFGSYQKETIFCLFVLELTPPPYLFLLAMQFGQLLTHLDTTQQMINNSLKDNNTLLTQVGSSASSSPSITDGLGDLADFA